MKLSLKLIGLACIALVLVAGGAYGLLHAPAPTLIIVVALCAGAVAGALGGGKMTDRVIGVLFIGAFPAVMFCGAWLVWPHWMSWVSIAVGMMWLPFLLTGLGVVPVNSRRDIDESAEIETIHIGLIALDQCYKGKFYAQCIGMLNECTEHHPAYEDGSGVRRWKVGRNHPCRQGLTNSGTTEDILAAAKSLLK